MNTLQIFDAFDQEDSLTTALDADHEQTIACLMAEQEDLEQQLNNVSDGDDGSEFEESELSVNSGRKNTNIISSL